MDSSYFPLDQAQQGTRVDSFKGASTSRRPGLMGARDLNQLEDLAEKKHPFVETAIKCKAFFMQILKVLDLNISLKDIDEINRTQEHLFTSHGSVVKNQVVALKEILETKDGLDQCKKDLNSYKPAEGLRFEFFYGFIQDCRSISSTDPAKAKVSKKYIKIAAAERNLSMQASVKKLAPGESVLIDGNVWNFEGASMEQKAGHAMVMRITRNHDDTYNMEFANTGLGITRNSDFHPKSKTASNEYQTVAVIQNISPEKLFKNHFFETFSSVACGGKIPTPSCIPQEKIGHARGLATQGENTHLEDRIDLMYLCMRQLKEPVRMEEGSRYHTQAQIGGSCAISSLWAISQLSLRKEEVESLKTDAKLKSLIRNYKKIQNGYDQSSTRKLMVLDQVQSLKQHYLHDQNANRILSKIEQELLSDLKIKRVEIKTSSKGKASITQFLEPQTKPGEFKLKAMEATLNLQDKRLKTDVEWKPVSRINTSSTSISYDVKQDPKNPNRYIGKTKADSFYLLYFAIANGDQEASADYLLQFMNNKTLSDKDKKEQTCELFINLLNSLGDSNLRSDIAKKYFIVSVLTERYNYSKGEYFEHMQSIYKGMEVEAHLTEGNIWVKAINYLKPSS